MSVLKDLLAELTALCGAPEVPAILKPTQKEQPMPIPTTAPVTLANGPDGPTCIVAYDSGPTKATWLVTRCYERGGGGKFAGTFWSSQVMNHAGTWLDVACNPGLIDGTPGAEQGNWDFGVMVDGKPANISFVGKYQGNDAALAVWPPNTFAIGSKQSLWKALWMTEVASVPGLTLPPGARGWVSVNGGWTPVYAKL